MEQSRPARASQDSRTVPAVYNLRPSGEGTEPVRLIVARETRVAPKLLSKPPPSVHRTRARIFQHSREGGG